MSRGQARSGAVRRGRGRRGGRARGRRRPRCRPRGARGSPAPSPARRQSSPTFELALDPAEAGRVHPHPDAGRDPLRRLRTTRDLDRHDAAEARVPDPFHGWMAPQPGGELGGVRLRALDPQVQGAQPAQRQPDLEGPGDRAVQRAVGDESLAVGATASVLGVTTAPSSTSLWPEGTWSPSGRRRRRPRRAGAGAGGWRRCCRPPRAPRARAPLPAGSAGRRPRALGSSETPARAGPTRRGRRARPPCRRRRRAARRPSRRPRGRRAC